MNCKNVFIFIFLMLSVFISGTEYRGEEVGGNKNLKVINRLKVSLALDNGQVEEISKVFKASDTQKKVDLELYRSSPLALIRAAERRREITDSRIMDILRDDQISGFESFLKQRSNDEELFRLTEGLLLTGKQVIKAELIISEYANILKRLYLRLGYYVRSGKDKNVKGSKGQKLLGKRRDGLEGRSSLVEELEKGPPVKILDIQKEKAKRISKFLNEEQRQLYKKLLDYQEKELAGYIRRLRKEKQ